MVRKQAPPDSSRQIVTEDPSLHPSWLDAEKLGERIKASAGKTLPDWLLRSLEEGTIKPPTRE